MDLVNYKPIFLKQIACEIDSGLFKTSRSYKPMMSDAFMFSSFHLGYLNILLCDLSDAEGSKKAFSIEDRDTFFRDIQSKLADIYAYLTTSPDEIAQEILEGVVDEMIRDIIVEVQLEELEYIHSMRRGTPREMGREISYMDIKFETFWDIFTDYRDVLPLKETLDILGLFINHCGPKIENSEFQKKMMFVFDMISDRIDTATASTILKFLIETSSQMVRNKDSLEFRKKLNEILIRIQKEFGPRTPLSIVLESAVLWTIVWKKWQSGEVSIIAARDRWVFGLLDRLGDGKTPSSRQHNFFVSCGVRCLLPATKADTKVLRKYPVQNGFGQITQDKLTTVHFRKNARFAMSSGQPSVSTGMIESLEKTVSSFGSDVEKGSRFCADDTTIMRLVCIAHKNYDWPEQECDQPDAELGKVSSLYERATFQEVLDPDTPSKAIAMIKRFDQTFEYAVKCLDHFLEAPLTSKAARGALRQYVECVCIVISKDPKQPSDRIVTLLNSVKKVLYSDPKKVDKQKTREQKQFFRLVVRLVATLEPCITDKVKEAPVSEPVLVNQDGLIWTLFTDIPDIQVSSHDVLEESIKWVQTKPHLAMSCVLFGVTRPDVTEMTKEREYALKTRSICSLIESVDSNKPLEFSKKMAWVGRFVGDYFTSSRLKTESADVLVPVLIRILRSFNSLNFQYQKTNCGEKKVNNASSIIVLDRILFALDTIIGALPEEHDGAPEHHLGHRLLKCMLVDLPKTLAHPNCRSAHWKFCLHFGSTLMKKYPGVVTNMPLGIVNFFINIFKTTSIYKKDCLQEMSPFLETIRSTEGLKQIEPQIVFIQILICHLNWSFEDTGDLRGWLDKEFSGSNKGCLVPVLMLTGVLAKIPVPEPEDLTPEEAIRVLRDAADYYAWVDDFSVRVCEFADGKSVTKAMALSKRVTIAKRLSLHFRLWEGGKDEELIPPETVVTLVERVTDKISDVSDNYVVFLFLQEFGKRFFPDDWRDRVFKLFKKVFMSPIDPDENLNYLSVSLDNFLCWTFDSKKPPPTQSEFTDVINVVGHVTRSEYCEVLIQRQTMESFQANIALRLMDNTQYKDEERCFVRATINEDTISIFDALETNLTAIEGVLPDLFDPEDIPPIIVFHLIFLELLSCKDDSFSERFLSRLTAVGEFISSIDFPLRVFYFFQHCDVITAEANKKINELTVANIKNCFFDRPEYQATFKDLRLLCDAIGYLNDPKFVNAPEMNLGAEGGAPEKNRGDFVLQCVRYAIPRLFGLYALAEHGKDSISRTELDVGLGIVYRAMIKHIPALATCEEVVEGIEKSLNLDRAVLAIDILEALNKSGTSLSVQDTVRLCLALLSQGSAEIDKFLSVLFDEFGGKREISSEFFDSLDPSMSAILHIKYGYFNALIEACCKALLRSAHHELNAKAGEFSGLHYHFSSSMNGNGAESMALVSVAHASNLSQGNQESLLECIRQLLYLTKTNEYDVDDMNTARVFVVVDVIAQTSPRCLHAVRKICELFLDEESIRVMKCTQTLIYNWIRLLDRLVKMGDEWKLTSEALRVMLTIISCGKLSKEECEYKASLLDFVSQSIRRLEIIRLSGGGNL